MRGKFHMGPTNHADAIWTSRLNSLPTHKSFVWLFTRGHMDIAGDSRAGELSNAARISLGNPFPPPLLQEWQAFAAQLKYLFDKRQIADLVNKERNSLTTHHYRRVAKNFHKNEFPPTKCGHEDPSCSHIPLQLRTANSNLLSAYRLKCSIALDPEEPTFATCLLCRNELRCGTSHISQCPALPKKYTSDALSNPEQAQCLGNTIMQQLITLQNFPTKRPRIWATRRACNLMFNPTVRQARYQTFN